MKNINQERKVIIVTSDCKFFKMNQEINQLKKYSKIIWHDIDSMKNDESYLIHKSGDHELINFDFSIIEVFIRSNLPVMFYVNERNIPYAQEYRMNQMNELIEFLKKPQIKSNDRNGCEQCHNDLSKLFDRIESNGIKVRRNRLNFIRIQ
jgi:hypothetical protein